MPVKLGPAGIPLSCKGRTIVEGMDDIISLGLEEGSMLKLRETEFINSIFPTSEGIRLESKSLEYPLSVLYCLAISINCVLKNLIYRK